MVKIHTHTDKHTVSKEREKKADEMNMSVKLTRGL